jgi:hypothetical protein
MLHGVLVGIVANIFTIPMMLTLLIFLFPEELAKHAADPN